MLGNLWDRFKWLGTHLLWFIAGIILLIDPGGIDSIIAAHPKWSGAILAVWTAILSWAQKTRPQQQSVQGVSGLKTQ